MLEQAAMLAVDGILAQCGAAKALYDRLGVTDAPVQAIYAAAVLLREVLDAAQPAATLPFKTDVDNGCDHGHVDEREMPDGTKLFMCNDCDEILAQGVATD